MLCHHILSVFYIIKSALYVFIYYIITFLSIILKLILITKCAILPDLRGWVVLSLLIKRKNAFKRLKRGFSWIRGKTQNLTEKVSKNCLLSQKRFFPRSIRKNAIFFWR